MTKRLTANGSGLKVIQHILATPKILAFNLADHKLFSDSDWGNECGYTLYELQVLIPEGEAPRPDGILRVVDDFPELNRNEYEPRAYYIVPESDPQMGEYHYKIIVRNSFINLPEVSFSIDIVI